MFDGIRNFFARRAMRRRIAALSTAERERILAASNLEAAGFQGEGFHVFRKDIADTNQAYVCSLGEIATADAEDWIIARYLDEEDRRGLPK